MSDRPSLMPKRETKKDKEKQAGGDAPKRPTPISDNVVQLNAEDELVSRIQDIGKKALLPKSPDWHKFITTLNEFLNTAKNTCKRSQKRTRTGEPKHNNAPKDPNPNIKSEPKDPNPELKIVVPGYDVLLNLVNRVSREYLITWLLEWRLQLSIKINGDKQRRPEVYRKVLNLITQSCELKDDMMSMLEVCTRALRASMADKAVCCLGANVFINQLRVWSLGAKNEYGFGSRNSFFFLS